MHRVAKVTDTVMELIKIIVFYKLLEIITHMHIEYIIFFLILIKLYTRDIHVMAFT